MLETHIIHVRYIYLHLVDFYGFHVGKYTIVPWIRHGGGFVEQEYTYEVVQTFYAVSGGSWSRRPAGIDTLWRLQNVQVTLGPWSLNELEFYDPWCFFRRCFWKESFGGGGWLVVVVVVGWLWLVGWRGSTWRI